MNSLSHARSRSTDTMLEAYAKASRHDSAGWQALRWEIACLVGESLVSQAAIGRFLLEQGESCVAAPDQGRVGRGAAGERHDDILLRMRVAAFAACPRRGGAEECLQAEIGRLTRGAGGVAHAAVAGRLVILMPDFESKLDCDMAAADLMRIFDEERAQSSDWIVDFSAVTHLPSLLLMGLLA